MKSRCLCLLALAAALLSACAETDPYKRIAPTPASDVDTSVLVKQFDNRWPRQFKCVQTVTIDFGPVTRTFTALLIVQRPGRFRLQGMTEQGLKLFDLAHNAGRDKVIFKGDELGDEIVAGVSRDIRRVFLDELPGIAESRHDDQFYYLAANTPELTTRAILTGGSGKMSWAVKGDNLRESRVAWVDRFELSDNSGELFRCAFYEWQTQPAESQSAGPGSYFPGIVVLRDTGRQGKSYPYKLTLRITELTVRDTPWPDKVFNP
jgi:hypothetical protein